MHRATWQERRAPSGPPSSALASVFSTCTRAARQSRCAGSRAACACLTSASACGAQVKDYAHALAHDPAYAERARQIVSLTRDISELLPDLVPRLKPKMRARGARKLAFHPPCTLQHGQQLRGGVETHLAALGFDVKLALSESHLCCGSAGTYSVLQPELAHETIDGNAVFGRALLALYRREVLAVPARVRLGLPPASTCVPRTTA